MGYIDLFNEKIVYKLKNSYLLALVVCDSNRQPQDIIKDWSEENNISVVYPSAPNKVDESSNFVDLQF